MTDLDATSAGTRTCAACGAQNAADRRSCEQCGAELLAAAPDAQREDLELEEAWRAVAAEGFDADMVADESGTLTCPTCATRFPVSTRAVRIWRVRDTATDRTDLAVVAVRCPNCGTEGRAEVAATVVDAPPSGEPQESSVEPDEVGTGEVDWRHPPPEGSTPEHPLGEDRQFFEEAEPGTLAEQRDLLDDEGEDIRQYTGEPVETEEGWVLPQQQNVGPGNEAGGGEWPDPATPSAMPKGDAPPEPDDDRRP